jgi:predicted Zn-dependent protease
VPGGAVYVHTGLIQAVNDAAELAGVLAHEIGHVTSRHVAKMARTGRNTSIVQQVATVIIAILTGSQVAAQGADLATGVAAQAYMSTFTQDAEREADGQAIDTMIRAGFDPNGIVTMFETLREEAKGSSRPPQFLSSHPAPTERILSAQAAIRAREPLSGLRRDDGGKLEIIQERLRLIIGIDVEELLEDDDDE